MKLIEIKRKKKKERTAYEKLTIFININYT